MNSGRIVNKSRGDGPIQILRPDITARNHGPWRELNGDEAGGDGVLTAHTHSATGSVGRSETSITEAAELLRRQTAKLSLQLPAPIRR